MEKRELSKTDLDPNDERLKALAKLRPTPDEAATLEEEMEAIARDPDVSTTKSPPETGSTRAGQVSAQDAAQQPGFKNDQFASHRPSIGRRRFLTLASFFIAALVAVGVPYAWQSHHISTTKSPNDVAVAKEQSGTNPAGQMSARDVAPQPTPVTQTAPALAASVTSPQLVQQFEDMARDIAVMRNNVEQLAAKQEQMAHNIATLQAVEGDLAVVRHSVEQLAAKQEQMAQNIAALQAAEQDIIQKMSSPPLSGPVPIPSRKPRVAPPKPAAQSSSPLARRPFPNHPCADGYIQASFSDVTGDDGFS